MRKLSLGIALALVCASAVAAAAPRKVLLIDGQNNHDWKATTPVLQKILEEGGRFTVEVSTTPPKGGDMTAWKPRFADYAVVVSNYNGEAWSPETREAFVKYVKGGGGFVSVHAANNAFPEWPEYNEMIGLGGWGDRNEKSGPYVRFIDGKVVRDDSAGPGGAHGTRHPFVVEARDAKHPIMRGLPPRWKHAKDELYDRLRGPAKKLTVLATAFADPEQKGSGFHEPMLMTIAYGKGRVFHTTLGHDLEAMNCVGFATTLVRGTEWAATGKVTAPVPKSFPTADEVSKRE